VKKGAEPEFEAYLLCIEILCRVKIQDFSMIIFSIFMFVPCKKLPRIKWVVIFSDTAKPFKNIALLGASRKQVLRNNIGYRTTITFMLCFMLLSELSSDKAR
jgi:hypothetical protein